MIQFDLRKPQFREIQELRSKRMFKSDQQKEMSLGDVLSELMRSNPSEYHEVSLVAKKITHYFRQPAHEIAVTSIKGGLGFFPLYLSFERLPLYLIEILLKDADRLVSATEAIQNTIDVPKQESASGGDDWKAAVSCEAANNLIAEGAQS